MNTKIYIMDSGLEKEPEISAGQFETFFRNLLYQVKDSDLDFAVAIDGQYKDLIAHLDKLQKIAEELIGGCEEENLLEKRDMKILAILMKTLNEIERV